MPNGTPAQSVFLQCRAQGAGHGAGGLLLLLAPAGPGAVLRFAGGSILVARIVVQAHGERDALARQVHRHHLDLDQVAGLHHFARILHELARQGGDVHQAILVNADVHESAEVGDVGDGAFEHHAGFQVLEGLHPLLEAGGAEFGTGIAARFFQFGEDVDHRGQAEALVGERFRIEFAQEVAVADEAGQLATALLRDTLHHAVGLGVHGAGIQGVLAVADAQEARGLLEGLGSQPRHLQQHLALAEGSVGVAVLDDILRQGWVQAGNARQQGGGGGVQVHAHGVHAVLHHVLQGTGQFRLVYVVLVLAHADGLGIDLHQLGQGILQPAGDGDGAAQAHVQLGELRRGQRGGGVDRGARFAHHEETQPQFRVLFRQLLHQLLGFARGGAVADAHQRDAVPAD